LCTPLYDVPAPEGGTSVRFIDDQDGVADGHIAVESGRPKECAGLEVGATGYYALYVTVPLADTCSKQVDETVFFEVTNSCTASEGPIQSNAGDRYLVLDSDNTASCDCPTECGDCSSLEATCQGACDDGAACYGREPEKCCVSTDPVFLGTFFLEQGRNELCMNLWCDTWERLRGDATSPGFISETPCEGANSASLLGDHLLAVPDEGSLHQCSGGCEPSEGTCLPAPCETMSCSVACKDGNCVDDPPCADKTCRWGCQHGLCLEGPRAQGPDEDGDGYAAIADCDDERADVSPSCTEACDDDMADEDCDGLVDEGCPAPDAGMAAAPDAGTADARVAVEGGPETPSGGVGLAGGGGCAVGASRSQPRNGLGLLLPLLLVLSFRRRR
jgi:hypothetical protein